MRTSKYILCQKQIIRFQSTKIEIRLIFRETPMFILLLELIEH
jgi:hypothetical protein